MNKIKGMRKKENMTQAELAHRIGVAQPTVAGWEANKRCPRPDMLVKLAKLFDCTVDDLLGYGHEEKTA